MTRRVKRPAVPKILPREPLTKKARGAILQYVIVRSKGQAWLFYGVELTLKAERMRRADLYAWLQAKEYRWYPKRGSWAKMKREDAQP